MPLPPLDPTERHILQTLARRRGQVVPVAALMPTPVWGAADPEMRKRLLRVRLSGLRAKLRAAGFCRDSIVTVHGVGLRLEMTAAARQRQQ